MEFNVRKGNTAFNEHVATGCIDLKNNMVIAQFRLFTTHNSSKLLLEYEIFSVNYEK